MVLGILVLANERVSNTEWLLGLMLVFSGIKTFIQNKNN